MDFLNVLFLAGAATALVPIIIHLVQRRRVQRVVFGSLRFLRKTSHTVVHRRRFEEILLVILRALALALLAAAFARPFFRKPQELTGRKMLVGEEAALVMIDNSYSMSHQGRLDRAKEEALKFLREADPATKVGVAVYSSQFEELCPIGSKAARAEEAVNGIRPSWRGTKLDLALKQANRVLTRAGRNEAYRRIVLIGDFQDSSWPNRGDWTLEPGIELTVRNVAPKALPNVLVGRVVVPRLVVAGGFVEVISASVQNLTDKPLNDALVTLRVDGEEKGTQSVNIRPGQEAPVRFRHKFTEPGDVIGSIAVRGDDDAPQDNVAYFCVHVTPRVHVLLVNADMREKMVLNDGLFAMTALVPGTEDVVSPFEVRQIAPEEMKPADLQGVDVVLFLNVSRVPASMTRVPTARQNSEGAQFHSPLGRFVAAGGGIGFFCGTKVSPDEFNRTFGGLAPCKLLRPAMEEGAPPVVINQTDLRHEVFRVFADPHSGDFSLAEFSQYLLVTESLQARVLARFSNPDAHPALLERTFTSAEPSAGVREAGNKRDEEGDENEEPRSAPGGEPEPGPPSPGQAGSGPPEGRPTGKAILFVSSMDMEWNNLCLKSVFVPFVHQLAKRLCARRAGSVRNFIVADDITYYLPKEAKEAKLRHMAEKSGKAEWTEPVELRVQSGPGGSLVSFSPEAPGIHELAYKGGSARFAINLDPREPDFRPMDTKLLLAAVQKGPTLEPKDIAGTVSVAAKSSADERVEARQKLWRYLLLAVLVLQVGEMLLAARIGRA